MPRWTFDQIPDQTGRTAIVTGANSGIGFETARMLALKGAHVTLACRSEARGRTAVDRIVAEKPDAAVALERLDLADLDDVEAFSTRVREAGPLDVLVLNAGVMVPPESKTKQGFELQFGVNHLGHFALTGHLLDRLKQAERARVVVVSSLAATRGTMDFDDLQFSARPYDPWPAYAQSKLANQLFVMELQRRVEAGGLHITVTGAHPGWTATELQKNATVYRLLNPLFAMKPPQGALPSLRAATDPDAKGGSYFAPHGLAQARGYPTQVPMVARAVPEDARRLFDVSEQLTDVHYGLS